MFDKKTQKMLDAMRFKRCDTCKKWFLVRGVRGSTAPTLKKHVKIHAA